MDSLARRLGEAAGLDRVEAMLAVRAGKLEVARPTLQWAGELYMPGLRATPWYEREELPWVCAVEADADQVHAELLALEDDGEREAYGSRPDEWDALLLYRGGRWMPNAARTPATRGALESSPMSVGEAFFSVLAPGGRIPLHSGQWNIVLTCHLGLIVPSGCAITVGGQQRSWEQGRMLVFDDSFAHSAWNDAASPRVCLLWDVWHPDLTSREIAALKVLLPLLSAQRGPGAGAVQRASTGSPRSDAPQS